MWPVTAPAAAPAFAEAKAIESFVFVVFGGTDVELWPSLRSECVRVQERQVRPPACAVAPAAAPTDDCLPKAPSETLPFGLAFGRSLRLAFRRPFGLAVDLPLRDAVDLRNEVEAPPALGIMKAAPQYIFSSLRHSLFQKFLIIGFLPV